MKNLLLTLRSCKLKMFFLMLNCIFISSMSKAQVLVPPANPDVFLTSTLRGGLNCDMLSTPTGSLKAFVWWNLPNATRINVSDNVGGAVNITLPSGSSWADIALANDVNPTKYIAAVVYNVGINVFFRTYSITGVGSGGPLSAALTSNSLVSSAAVGDISAHIDMFADPNNIVNGYPSMHKFVFTWTQYISNFSTIYAAHGDISTPTTYTTTLIASGAGSKIADVSASYNLSTGSQKAYLAICTPGVAGLSVSTLDIATSVVTPTPISTALVPLYPRIESMGLYDPTVSNDPWTVASSIYNTTTLSYDVYKFNTSGSFNCSSSGFSGSGNAYPVVAAGVGNSSQFCNENYSIGWGVVDSTYLITQAVDYFTGNISTTYPDYYQANSNIISNTFDKSAFAMSSCSNSGRELLTAWNDQNGSIYYKLTSGISVYKPSPLNIADVDPFHEMVVYPNPGKELISISNFGSLNVSKLELYNILGQQVHGINFNKKEDKFNLNISGLLSGIYTIKVYTDKGTVARKLEIIK
jgi:hypothetical protein